MLGGLLGLVGLSAIAGILVTATVTPAIAVSGYAASSALESFDNMPSYLRIDRLMLPTEFYRKDSAGNDVLMAQFYDQNRIPVTLTEVTPVMADAMIASEDKDFFEHGGVNLVGTVSAIVDSLTGGDTRGGSSITQQYVKNVQQQACSLAAKDDDELSDCYDSTTVATGSEGYQRKLQEMRYAIRLEKEYSKDEILLGYLNIAHFGGVTYGVGAAAQRYFGVSVSDLTIAQAATIAGMVQAPNVFRIDLPEGSTVDENGELVNGAEDGYSRTLDRRNYVLWRMLADGRITQAEYDEAYATPIEPNITSRPQGCELATGAEFFCEYVRSLFVNNPDVGDTTEERQAELRRGGYKVYTTLDPDLQQTALDAISIVPGHVDYMNLGASGVQVEVGTGRVLSMVQNRPYNPIGDDDSGNDNGTTTPVNYNVRVENGGGGHSAGSTYKVFSLINWLEQGYSVNEVLNGRYGQKRVINCDDQVQNVTAGNGTGNVANFENNPGYSGTIYNFMRDSLNSGFFAMAERISVCSTNQVAGKLGVTWDDGTPLTEVPSWSTNTPNQAYDVLGSSAVAPIDMAGAYAAIAAGGVLCSPKAIDRIVDRDGNELPDQTSCERVMSEGVAATAAYTLEGVMNGTGSGARIYDGVPVFGKTGIHEYYHTWMDGSSTEVTTVVWVGNVVGDVEINWYYENGWQLARIRNAIWPEMQGAANAKYGGEAFPAPDSDLTRRVLIDLPSVIGRSVDEATRILEAAGFGVSVGDPVDASERAGIIVEQDPGAGKVGGGLTVTIRPSSGNGVSVPGISGTLDDARSQLRSAGFSNVSAQCSERSDAPESGVVTGTSPSAGTVVSRSSAITINYQARSCP